MQFSFSFRSSTNLTPFFQNNKAKNMTIIMSIQKADTTIRLPTTPEGARNRYLACYRKYFIGQVEDRERLANEAEAKMIRMSRKARRYYEQQFPTLINQATNALLLHDTRTSDGQTKFHEAHRDFLRILDSLMTSQPAEGTTYQQELERENLKRSYEGKHKKLRAQLKKLEAKTFDCDELGEDDDDSPYSKTMVEIDKIQQELKTVAEIILKMNEEDAEPEEPFKLTIVPRTVLARLSQKEVENLELQIITFLEKNSNKKIKIYVQKDIITGMIEQLKFKEGRFSKEDLESLSKDVLDAYKTFFRERDNKRREERYDELLESKELMPTEGLILRDPDDITPEVREKLEESDRKRKRKEDEIAESFARAHPEAADNEKNVESVEDHESDNENGNTELNNLMRTSAHLFKRVKEEPVDDLDDPALYYGSSSSDEEEPSGEYDPDEKLLAEDVSENEDDEYHPALNNHEERLAITNDDIEDLGVVAPQAKVEVVTISDDDDL